MTVGGKGSAGAADADSAPSERRVVHGDGAAWLVGARDDFALAPRPLKTLGHAGHVAAGDTSGIAFMQTTTQVAHAGPE